MLLAGDVGGTKTLLGLFQRADPRPQPVAVRAYPTNEFASFTDILQAFSRDVLSRAGASDNRDAAAHVAVEAAAIGVAGPVVNRRAQLTNIVWDISAEEVSVWSGSTRARLLNDLEAMANSVDVLTSDELVTLQAGEARADGNAVVIAAGTGLGEAYLHRVNGRLRPVPSEGGHADFAARTDREIELLRFLRTMNGRADVEHVLSGRGLINLYRFTHAAAPCDALDGLAPGQEPAAISQAGLLATCPRCAEALELFVAAYGSEAGNLAMRGVATAGTYIGGGIAPKILPALQRGSFMEAFDSKPPMTELLSRIPVKVILNPEAALLGAAIYASEM